MSNRTCCRGKCHSAIRCGKKADESVIKSVKNTVESTFKNFLSPSSATTHTFMTYAFNTNVIASFSDSTLEIYSYNNKNYNNIYNTNRQDSSNDLRNTKSEINITTNTILDDNDKASISAAYSLERNTRFNRKNNRSTNEYKNIDYLNENLTLKRKLRKHRYFLKLLTILLVFFLRVISCHGLLVVDPTYVGIFDSLVSNPNSERNNSILGRGYKNDTRIGSKPGIATSLSSSATGATAGFGYNPSSASAVSGNVAYLNTLDSLERSVAAVIIKVAYGTTSTTKRSIPDNSYVPSLTTIATPPLTTLSYIEKSPHHLEINLHHRNYELDLERDHALPTSAPNADILKSNSNPTYPNPNRHHNHDRERHRNILISSPAPSMSNILKKNINGLAPNIPIYPGDIPSYSPPARSFFTPPLPPEYQNPFADKPTLRGTNNDGVVANAGTYINRRPIPPPSLMPGHERIPFRPPDLVGSFVSSVAIVTPQSNYADVFGTFPSSYSASNPMSSSQAQTNAAGVELERKKTLNTSRETSGDLQETTTQKVQSGVNVSSDDHPSSNTHISRQEVLPSIRRILSGSNGNEGEIPEVLLKQVTSRPLINYHQPPSSPVVMVDSTSQDNIAEDFGGGLIASSNINKSKANSKNNSESGDDQGNFSKITPKIKIYTKSAVLSQDGSHQLGSGVSSTPAAVSSLENLSSSTTKTTSVTKGKGIASNPTNNSPSSSSATAAAAAAHTTWAVAWNIHVYLSVILFTILGVYSFYKILTYNKLTHLFSQSYFICIHLILIIICSARIFYLCYDAYNIHGTFHLFVSEILLNLPATFLTISFSVLILFLFRKSLNHKNNRYSALIRPLTVIVGCGVHVLLCITLHYVESYTMQNHQQHLYYQQQLYRRQHAKQHSFATTGDVLPTVGAGAINYISSATYPTPPPRVLSLICQFIYIFICISLGSLYLYIYRILKRILRSKSQNYIHGFQNLSYAIHITIATALLFVLLAALQIFGAISISMTRPLITQITAEMDWLQWGYQFSLRLIEIAIITLMSWVAGLKASGGGLDTVLDERNPGPNSGGDTDVFGSANEGSREKHSHHHHHHTNVAGFFLPCTSSSSQEQFETDYPAVCNANTNLHTYTMRTGKLIYDDSFALSSLGGAGQPASIGGVGRNADFQLQQQAYQCPYDTGSLQSSANHNCDFSSQNSHYQQHGHRKYGDYMTDGTTDHYENPNFELHAGNSSNAGNPMQKLTAQISTTSTTGSCSGGSGTSAASQQQMLLLQSDSCYSEPMHQNYNASSNYEFNNFERPKFGGAVDSGGVLKPMHVENWSEPHAHFSRNREKKLCSNLERAAYENPERRSSNSTHSCSSSGGRYAIYNSFELSTNSACVRKSGTLNNIASGIIHGRNASSSSASSSIIIAPQRTSGVQTLASGERNHLHQQQQMQLYRNGRNMLRGIGINHDEHENASDHDFSFDQTTLEFSSNNSLQLQQHQKQQHSLQHHSDEDMMLPGSNAERTNLISNDGDTCAFTKSCVTSGATDAALIMSDNDRLLGQSIKFPPPPPTSNKHLLPNNFQHCTSTGPNSVASSASNSAAESSTASTASATSGNMLVAVHGFMRFKTLEEKNNAQGARSLDNASIYHKRSPPAAEQAIAQNS